MRPPITETARPHGLSNIVVVEQPERRADTPTTVIAMATLVPMCSALLRCLESVESPPLTRNEPMIDAIMPMKAIAIGNTSKLMTPSFPASSAAIPIANAVSEIGAMIEPAYDSNRSAPMPATSPTLSPTLSAIVAGLRGSSSGIPASTLPTRSAPTSAALV